MKVKPVPVLYFHTCESFEFGRRSVGARKETVSSGQWAVGTCVVNPYNIPSS